LATSVSVAGAPPPAVASGAEAEWAEELAALNASSRTDHGAPRVCSEVHDQFFSCPAVPSLHVAEPVEQRRADASSGACEESRGGMLRREGRRRAEGEERDR
jgi:hypothetical protein